MPKNLTLEQQIEKYIDDPDLRHLLNHSADIAPLLDSIEDTYSSLARELKSVKRTLEYRTRAFETSRKLLTKKNQEISHRANHDSLTGLPNREYLYERLNSSVLQSQRNDTPFALLFIDLDKFKIVNDNFGHDIGDILLQKIAERMRTVIRETDTIARLAGDEFCILLMNVESPTDSARVAHSLLRKFTQPFQIENNDFIINMSIGISHYPDDGKTTTTLLKNADIAMYEAKQKGTNHIQFYEKRLTEQVSERIEFEKDLYEAVENKDFCLQFEPVLNTDSKDLTAAIVSVSWLHPVRGRIYPKNFYDVVTDKRLYLPVVEWVIEQCCLQLKIWENKQLPDISISVAIEKGQFLHKELIRSIITILNRYPNAAKCIELTVSEDIIAVNQNLALRQFKQLDKLGFKLAISNCGSGLLPMNFFQKANINSIYLDSSLVQKLDSSDSSALLIGGIIDMLRKIQIKTHAPGIQNINQLQNINCETVSGKHFGEPMSEKEFQIIHSRFKTTEPPMLIQDNLLLG